MMKNMGKTDWKRLKNIKDKDIDYSDIPPLPDDPEFWEKAEVVFPESKEKITMMVDKDVLQYFRNQGRGYQGRMNAVLKSFVKAQNHGIRNVALSGSATAHKRIGKATPVTKRKKRGQLPLSEGRGS